MYSLLLLLQSALIGASDSNDLQVTLHIRENTKAGSMIGFPATAEKHGEKYADYRIIEGNQLGLFQIDAASGAISVAQEGLDFESTPHWRLVVTASPIPTSGTKENTPPSLEEQFIASVGESVPTERLAVQLGQRIRSVVDIRVDDENERPEIADQYFRVPEGSFAGTVVGLIQARDTDTRDTLNLRLLKTPVVWPFELGESGKLFISNPSQLDFESQSTFRCQVEARDSAGLSALAWLTIDVTDINEAPLASSSSTLLVDTSNAGVRPWSHRLSVMDNDCDDTITYELIHDPTAGGFELDSETGELTLIDTNALTAFSSTACELQIRAMDASGAQVRFLQSVSWNSPTNSTVPISAPAESSLSITPTRLLTLALFAVLTTVASFIFLVFMLSGDRKGGPSPLVRWFTGRRKASGIPDSSSAEELVAVVAGMDSCEDESQILLQVQALQNELRNARTDAAKEREQRDREIFKLLHQMDCLHRENERLAEELRLSQIRLDESWPENEAIGELKAQIQQRNELIAALRRKLDEISNTELGEERARLVSESCDLAEPWERDPDSDQIVVEEIPQLDLSDEDTVMARFCDQIAAITCVDLNSDTNSDGVVQGRQKIRTREPDLDQPISSFVAEEPDVPEDTFTSMNLTDTSATAVATPPALKPPQKKPRPIDNDSYVERVLAKYPRRPVDAVTHSGSGDALTNARSHADADLAILRQAALEASRNGKSLRAIWLGKRAMFIRNAIMLVTMTCLVGSTFARLAQVTSDLWAITASGLILIASIVEYAVSTVMNRRSSAN
ncbi:MAG: hypothetical protein R3C20_15510 [Planctomycetaceae bacterium]